MHEESFAQEDINHDVGLLDKKTHRVFNDKLTFKYVEIAKFNKSEDELVTLYDKWLYLLRNLSRLDKQPASLKEKVFKKLFKEAEIAQFTPKEMREYEDSVKVYRDLKNSLDTALMQGIEQGLEQGRAEGIEQGLERGLKQGRAEGRAEGHAKGIEEGITKVARAMLVKGIPAETIAEVTGLSTEDIREL